MPRAIRLKPNDTVAHCPECGNNTEFNVYSEQCAEDCCEIWAVCKCGYNPSEYLNCKVEDVWGGTDDDNCFTAIAYSWTEAIEEIQEKGIKEKRYGGY